MTLDDDVPQEPTLVTIRHLLNPYRGLLVSATAFVTLASVCSLLEPLVIKWLIDGLLTRREIPILKISLVLSLVYGVRIIALYSGNTVNYRVLRKLRTDLRMYLSQRTLGLSLTSLANMSLGDLLVRIEGDLEIIIAVVTDALPSFIRIGISSIFVLRTIVYLDWRVAILVVPLIATIALARFSVRGKLRTNALRARQSDSERTSSLTDLFRNVQEVRGLPAELRMLSRYRLKSFVAARSQYDQQRAELRTSTWTTATLSMVIACALIVGSRAVHAEKISLGTYVAFYSYLRILFDQISALLDHVSFWQRFETSRGRINELIARPSVKMRFLPVTQPPTARLGIRDGNFSYASTGPVFTNLNFEIGPGERVVIMGPSGAGKTTIARLLAGSLELNQGTIVINGGVGKKNADRHVCVIPQDTTLLAETLRFNATVGTNRKISDEILEEAARRSAFGEVVAKFADGWSHQLDPACGGLSGGERQRLGIMRALLTNAPLLILDEATSSLDAETERRVLAGLGELPEKGILLITHRVSTIKWATRVLHLRANGNLVESSEQAIF